MALSLSLYLSLFRSLSRSFSLSRALSRALSLSLARSLPRVGTFSVLAKDKAGQDMVFGLMGEVPRFNTVTEGT